MPNRRKPAQPTARSLKELHAKAESLNKASAVLIDKMKKLSTEIEAERARRAGLDAKQK